MFPRYPGEVSDPSGGAAADPASWPASGGMPRQVRAAARLMYAGALFSAISWLYYGFSTSPSTAPRLVHIGNPHTDAYKAGWVIGTIMLAAIVAGSWLWMAWAVKRGRNWARAVSAVLLGLGADLLSGMVVSQAGVVMISSWALSWLAGLGAVILLSQYPSNSFFASRGTQAYLPGFPDSATRRRTETSQPPHDQAS